MQKLAEARLPTAHGGFTVLAFGEAGDRFPHVVLRGERSPASDVVDVRIHSECMTGDVFASLRCDCGAQLDAALAHIGEHGGLLIYLRQEGRGIGLVEKLKAYNLQEEGLDTFAANAALGHPEDGRDYQPAAEILKTLGIARVQLMTNNPEKVQGLISCGVEVVDRLPIEVGKHPENDAYLRAKRLLSGHFLAG
jgi:3,4-dihydroxy 2-butanone 4-phosphate synthase/GTP cyclohydrolase II